MATFLASPVQAFVIASLVVTGTYLYSKLYYRRFKQNAHLPQLPSSLLWGHLMAFDRYTKQGIPDRHPDIIFAEMHRALGEPPIMLLDNWPIVPPMVIVASHDVAEQVSRPSTKFQFSAPKSSSVDRIVNLIGPNSILLKQNEKWKSVRKRFNPGFAPQHLMTLLPVIIGKAAPYLQILDELAHAGEVFQFDQPTTNLTFDIIGAVAMDEDMGAQHQDPAHQGELIRMFEELIKTYADDKLQLPWWLMPRAHLRRRRLGGLISQQLKAIVSRNFEEMKVREHQGQAHSRSRSILALSLQDIESLTPEIMEETCDQLKTFLFAGHDTTSTTIVWSIYELFRTPHALKAVRAELDSLFGPGAARDPAIVRDKLLSPEGAEIIHRMTYISAVIREILRLHSPAGSIRVANPGSGFSVSTSRGEYNLDGNWIYINHNLIHRDRAVFGDTADNFVPERWLASDGLPASAWRPFERGPRNCIGQELANIETRIIIAMLVCRYEFTKVGLGEIDLEGNGQPTVNAIGQFKVKSELYSTIQITGKPVDGMMMKVKLATET
ncbi:cytochrome P450 [Annulohypoxylon maeteangense]|uniref:cytochrome P450 n=1 Tax=Annulohypoxylon maeteangense TaxID=1927788 RepID=UPI0020085A93|nr:cytochrome P450 [Annulohypoxylon maeteangense]KAI0883929.1 cytochrome P450 [Annulohypoxylon maeteangense]